MSHCCNDYTRAQALRASIARAGRGLPGVEPGMPVPAGTGMTRRSLLLRSAGMALAVYGAGRAVAPGVFDDAVAHAAGDHRTVVSIFFDGGIDSLSLLAPTGDPRYAALRPTLALGAGEGTAFAADERLRWHPAAQGLADLWADDSVGMAVAPAIGYSAPNQSHFTSRHFWEVGATDPRATTGWLGRYLDRVGADNVPIQGLSLGGTLSPQLATERVAVAAADDVAGYALWSPGVWGEMEQRMIGAFDALGRLPADDPVTAYARRVQANAADLKDDLDAVGAPVPPDGAGYPTTATKLRGRLQSLAQLLDTRVDGGRLPVRAVTVAAQGTYDTHSGQRDVFERGLRATADNVRAFWRDLQLRGLDDRVVVLLWSEFGRRPEENGSAGTDHGAGGCAFVLGKTVRQGLLGEFPGLESSSLDRWGNLRHTFDYRALYCALLEQWLGTEADGIIPGASGFERPALLAA